MEIIKRTCRLCLEKETEDNSHTEEVESELYELLLRYFGIDIQSRIDTVPNIICLFCTQTILDFHTFQTLVIKNQEKLLSYRKNKLKRVQIVETITTQEAYQINERSIQNELESSNLKRQLEVNQDTPELHNASLYNPYEKYKCRICEKQMYNKDEFSVHKYYHEGPQVRNHFVCEMCGKKFRNKPALNNHLKQHIEDPRNCPVCDEIHINEHKLKSHLLRAHVPYVNVRCIICGRIFKDRKALEVHLTLIHKGSDPCECEECGVVLSNYRSLIRHRYLIHNPKSYKYTCRHCGKKFNRKTGWQDHETTHTGERNYGCEFCDKNFRNKTNWHTHRIKIHPKEYLQWKRNKELEVGINSVL